ncbi:MAG TPA: nucleoside triphosphate pyrophosphohydrolase [Candidatus Acidoferrales bacterium]|nr:nucleoside triphosphate pyrophosphohydrolase [Candidatus Acidoferrales bacterium]
MPDAIDSPPPFPPGIPAVFEIARRLRAPDGCPWDREQTHASLRPYLLEETYELLEAIDSGDDVKVLEELGDVLLQVAMHVAIAEQEGRFDAAQVSEASAAKMVSRHPHVFAEAEVHNAEDVLKNWELEKQRQARQSGAPPESALDRVPPAMPALAWVYNMQKRAARVGFTPPAQDREGQELDRLSQLASTADSDRDREERVGDLLFAVVEIARRLRVNPEDALRGRGRRFRERFARMDLTLRQSGRNFPDLTADEMAAAWQQSEPEATIGELPASR